MFIFDVISTLYIYVSCLTSHIIGPTEMEVERGGEKGIEGVERIYTTFM